MKKSIHVFLTVALIVCFTASYAQVTRKLTLDKIDKISLNISADVVIKQGNQQEVVVEGTEKMIELLETEVEDGHWSIEFTQKRVSFDQKMIINITLPSLSMIKVNSSGDVSCEGLFTGENLKIAINGSGDIKLDLETKILDLSVNGSGDMHLNGKADETEVSINGSGDINAEKLTSKTADININGSGDLRIEVTDYLKADVNGSGNIRYAGDPNIKTRRNGSGSIKPI